MANDYLTFKEAAATLPKRPNVSTLHRWRLRGVRGVKLRSCLIGGRRYTTKNWLQEFIDAVSGSDRAHSNGVTNKKRATAIADAESFLANEGL